MKGFASPTDRKEIDLLEYARVVVKRKWVLVTFAAVLVALAAVLSFTRKPLYRATATLLIDEPGASLYNIQDVLNSGAVYRGDLLGTYFNTQLRLITSRSLAERVAKRLNVAARPEFRSQGRPAGRADANPAFVILKGLSIAPIPETRLVYVSYVFPHAPLAADVVNALVE
jgi:uncharacterized protein involved in exopolysaccharide biosynthesis